MIIKQPQTVETMYVLIGRWIREDYWMAQGHFPNDGTPVNVDFEKHYKEVIERHVNYNDIIGFYHTHPGMPGIPSSTDLNTMNTWVDVLGKPLLCLIDGVDGLQTYYWFGEDQFKTGKSFKLGNIFSGELNQNE